MEEEVKYKEPEGPVIKDRFKRLYKDEFFERPLTFYHNRQIFAQCLASFIGMFILVFFGTQTPWDIGWSKEVYFHPEQFIVMATAIMITYHINGSLLNASFNVSSMIMGRMGLQKFGLCTVFEVLGAVTAVAMIKNILGDPKLIVLNSPMAISELYSSYPWLHELLASFFVNLGVCGFIDARLTHGDSAILILFPIVFGLYSMIDRGVVLNPVRFLSYILFGGRSDYAVGRILLPLAGALLASLLYAVLLDSQLDEEIREEGVE